MFLVDVVPIRSKQTAPQSRKSLDFGASSNTQTSNDLFSDFTELSSVDNTTIENDRNGISLSQNEVTPSNNKKRSAEELFGDITDLEEDIFLDLNLPTIKKLKVADNEEKLALIEHILELRRLAKEKSNIVGLVSSKTLKHDSIERDKRNMSYTVPKYPFIGLTKFNKERVYVRFHSEEYEKEEIQRVVKESAFSGVMGEAFKEIWKQAKQLVSFV